MSKVTISNNGNPIVELIKTPRGHKVLKCCLSCEFYSPGSEKNVCCMRTMLPANKYGVCESYHLHGRYTNVGSSDGLIKKRAYYRWRLYLIRKFTKVGDTDWKALEEHCKQYGKDMYEYWKKNIKNNPKYEEI